MRCSATAKGPNEVSADSLRGGPETLEHFSSDMPRFSWADYELQRDHGETDEEYEARLNVFS